MIVPYDYQEAGILSFFNYLETQNGHPLICMPTGTGKSIVLGEIIRRIFRNQPYRRIIVLTHVWKLIEQNVAKLLELWPTAPVGIHSAGLDARDFIQPIIFGGVQSVVKNPGLFGHRDLLLIDEAHLLGPNDDSQYGEVIGALKAKNPHLRICGLTATPYRLKMGMLTEGGMFSDICYDITDFESFNRLIAENRLAPLIGKPTNTVIENLNTIKLVAGEYNQKQAEAVIDTDKVTYSAVQELIEFGRNRGTWMLFAAGVKNSEHLAEMLRQFGIPAACVHSKLSDKENKERLRDYDNGMLRAIVGNNMLTTGYDNTKIDLIADLQPTMSPGKHVQKLGRGTRVHRKSDYFKENCLVLDFVGNIWNNGPINDPRKPRKPGEPTGEVPVKICSTERLVQPTYPGAAQVVGCGAYNHASARHCCNCAGEFTFQTKVFATAKTDAPLKLAEEPVYQTVPVQSVHYERHPGKEIKFGKKNDTVKATYQLGYRKIFKFLCFEHTGLPKHHAHEWWRMHHHGEPPETVDEFLKVSEYGELRIPQFVRVHANKEFPEIVGYEF